MPLVSFRSNNQHDKSHFAPKIRVGTRNSYRGLYRFVRLICETLKSQHLYGKGASLSMCVLALACSGPKTEIEETAVPTSILSEVISNIHVETDPDWSPDGKWIAYSDWNDSSDIWIMSVTGGDPRRVTTDPARDILPRWSPDGKRILFVSTRGSGQRNLWTISPTGGTKTLFPVTSDADSVGNNIVNWSPDGTEIVYSAIKDGELNLWAISAQGTNPRQITDVPGMSWDPDWSPDGKWIAYNYVTGEEAMGEADLWIVSADGGEGRLLLNQAGPQWCPAWSPDGKWIAYCGFRPNENIAVWLMPSTGNNPQRISDPSSLSFRPRWSPDGKRLIFDASRDGGRAEVYSISNKSAKVIEPSIASHRGLVWSPDGQWIAFLLKGPEGFGIWRKPVEGGDPIRVTDDGTTNSPRWWNNGLSWSPDGQSIAFNSGIGMGGLDESAIWTVPVEGGEPDRITLGTSAGAMDWSPDSQTIVYNSNEAGTSDIWTVPSSGGMAEKLVDWPGNEWGPNWSPDGKQIAFAATGTPTVKHTTGEFDHTVWTVSVEDGQVKKLAEGIRPDWSPSGNEIIFLRRGVLYVIPSAGGKPTEMNANKKDWGGWPRWSPDGNQILYGVGDQRNLWIADVDGLVSKK